MVRIKDKDIACLRFILEGYEYMCFLDKCSRINDNITIFSTNFFYEETKDLLEHLSNTLGLKIISTARVSEDDVVLRYYDSHKADRL